MMTRTSSCVDWNVGAEADLIRTSSDRRMPYFFRKVV